MLAAGHLSLVAVGGAGWMRELGGRHAGRAVRWYGAMSGADAGYSYFAPHVGSELRIRFVLSDAHGRQWEDRLTADHNQEVRLRVGSMTGLFPADPEAEVFRHDLAASWAATMFGRHPTAERVIVEVDVHDVPSMADYRAGYRPEWVTVYAATFSVAPDSGT